MDLTSERKSFRGVVEVSDHAGTVEIEIGSKTGSDRFRDPEMNALLAEVTTLQKRMGMLEERNGNAASYMNVDATETTMDTSQSSSGANSRRASMNVSSLFGSWFGLAETQEEETNQSNKQMDSESVRDPEMYALLTEMNTLREDMTIFQKRVAKLEKKGSESTPSRDSEADVMTPAIDTGSPNESAGPQRPLMKGSKSVASVFRSVLGLGEEEDEETDQELHEDTYSFIMVSQLCSYSFVLGMLVFLTQQVVFFLMLWSLTGYDTDGNPQSGNLLGIPVNVDPQVRLAQMVALGFIVITQTDVIKGLDLVRLIRNESFHKAVPNIQTWRIALCITTLLLEGTFGILVSFMLIVTSENIVFLLLNFTAMAFVSELDEAVFFVTRYGFFGISCEADAAAVKNITYKVHKKSHRKREIWMLAVMFVSLVAGWGLVVYNQNQGVYQCSTLFVQFGDDVMPALGTFSGLYDLQKPEKRGVLTSEYMVYVERRSGRASFAYCRDLEAWTFRWHEEGEAGDDPCDPSWVAMSTKTLSYDITTTATKTWYARDKYSRVVVLEPFYLACYDCNIGGKLENCYGRGSCHNGVCKCEDGSFGLRCEFLDPCPSLAKNAMTAGFIGTRSWSDSFERLYVAPNATDGEENLGLVPVEVYDRPVYINATKEGASISFDLILFTGRRWIVTYSDFLLLENSSHIDDGDNPRLGLYQYLANFHAHWSNFSIAFVSEPVDIATPSDSNSPLDLKFYQAVAKRNSEQMEIQGADGIESDVRLLCAVCDNETNPCSYDGICTYQGNCSCNQGKGHLCEIPPVGNGFCNPYFNFREFNYDGGDCCAQTCQPEADYFCGMDSSGFGSIGYYNCKEITPKEWVQSEDFWTDYNGVALSEDGQFLVVSSPKQGMAMVFDRIGKDWIQRGEDFSIPEGHESYGKVHLAVASFAPMMVHSHTTLPPYLVLLPDLKDSIIRILICEKHCYWFEKQIPYTEDIDRDHHVVYAVSTDHPYLALRSATGTGGHQVLVYSMYDLISTGNLEAWSVEVGEGQAHITSISLSASGKTLAVQSLNGKWEQSPQSEVRIYDFDGTSGQYKERQRSLQFEGVNPGKGRLDSPLVISGDGTTIALSAASTLAGNSSSQVNVYVWDDDGKNWTNKSLIASSGNHNHTGVSWSSALSTDGRTLLYTDGAEVSVFERNGDDWLLVGRPVSSFIHRFRNLKSLAMNSDGSVVAMGIGDINDKEAQSVHVFSIPEQGCPGDMSLLRVSVTTDKQPDTKSWTLVSNKTQKSLFQSTDYPISMQYYESATYARQSCIEKDSCHLLSLYTHGLDGFQAPGGYHLTLDGVNVGSERFDSDSFNVAKRVFVGHCLSCDPGLRLFRFLVTTCETTASWELVDSFGKLLFSGNSSSLENNFGAKRLCAKHKQNGKISYVVPAPFWEEICIDPNECFSLKVSSPNPRSSSTQNRTRHYFVFDDGEIISEEESSPQESLQNSDEKIEKIERSIFGGAEEVMESVTPIGNCAPTSEPSLLPTMTPAPTAPTPAPTKTPSSAPSRFHISAIDRKWPGRYPTPANASNVITFNIRTDKFPEETKLKIYSIQIDDYLEGKDWSLVHEGGPREDQVEMLVSNDYDLENNFIYEFHIIDTEGDGICCGEHGIGWFTVTSAFTTLNNPAGTVVAEFYGDETQFASDYYLGLWVDSVGYIHRSGWIEGVGYVQLNADGSIPEDPMILKQDTPAPTVSQAPSVSLRPSSTPTISGAPTSRQFDPKLDDLEWPGAYPTQANSTNVINFNVRTDKHPEELSWTWSFRNDSTTNATHLWHVENFTNMASEQAEAVVSYSMVLENDSIYKLDITDTERDGTCCYYGFGWFAITSAAATQADPTGTVVWDILGDQIASGYSLYLQIDSEGHVHPLQFEITASKDQYSLDENVTFTYRNPAADLFWIGVYSALSNPYSLTFDNLKGGALSCGFETSNITGCFESSFGTVHLEDSIPAGEWRAFVMTPTSTGVSEPFWSIAHSQVFSVG